jgi:hypothetical protein
MMRETRAPPAPRAPAGAGAAHLRIWKVWVRVGLFVEPVDEHVDNEPSPGEREVDTDAEVRFLFISSCLNEWKC